jgi:predicted FMN-binding regulatory protein PaiB
MMASASGPSWYSSKRPEATNGATWNGFALERQ